MTDTRIPEPALPAARIGGVNNLEPLIGEGVEKEPMLLLDTTGSMSYPIAEGSAITRKDLVGEALGALVGALEAFDSQALDEAAAGEDAGGVMTITFAGGFATNIGDLARRNWREKWDKIQWGGGTAIMPGWALLEETYADEFGDRPNLDRPNILGIVVTDGELTDAAQFEATLRATSSRTFVVIALVGYGTEHDDALRSYQKIAETNKRIRVVSFDSETDPLQIAADLLELVK
jgi:uncharacterized protein YegL